MKMKHKQKICKVLSRIVSIIDKSVNCGTGSGGFKPGNSCARPGGGVTTITMRSGEVLHTAERGTDKVWRLHNGHEAPPHIQKMKIPPAWKNVTVNLDPKGDLLAVGDDAKGRAQYRYGDTHTMRAAALKFGRVSELRKKRDAIFKEVERDIKKGKHQEEALVTKLIMKTGMRPGSETDTGASYKSYGATTLEGRHVIQNPDGSVVLRFVPGKKKGKEIEMPIADKLLGQQLMERATKAGSDGKLFATTADAVRTYSKTKDGGGFKTKDHRTALGTETAIHEIMNAPMPKNKKEYVALTKKIATKVSDVLGNTPAIAFKSYIDPTVWAGWKKKVGA